jgi:hypothetical protein
MQRIDLPRRLELDEASGRAFGVPFLLPESLVFAILSP